MRIIWIIRSRWIGDTAGHCIHEAHLIDYWVHISRLLLHWSVLVCILRSISKYGDPYSMCYIDTPSMTSLPIDPDRLSPVSHIDASIAHGICRRSDLMFAMVWYCGGSNLRHIEMEVHAMGFALSAMQVSSAAFDQHGKIPVKYTGEGEDISPPLQWTEVPDGTSSFAVVCHDPDAPVVKASGYGFVHWVLYNLSGATRGVSEDNRVGTQGANDFQKLGYGGPMPPEGHGTHHYYFWVLAMNRQPDLEPGLTLEGLLKQVEPHVIGMNRLVGSYKRVS